MLPDQRSKLLLQDGRLLVVPGVFDMISARIADAMQFDALYATGFGMVASYLGVADVGIATFTDMLSCVRRLAETCNTPLIADADTGYGGLLNLRNTVQAYEAAGVAAIQLEDQEFPKRCGHLTGRRVIAADEMAVRIEVAVASRRSSDFLIVARTDARTGYGLDEAISRGRLYAKAGADIVFVESPETEDEMACIGQSIDAPLLANMVEGGRTPILSARRLEQLGYAIAIYPAIGFLAMARALEDGYAKLRMSGENRDQGYGFDRMCTLMGVPDALDFERRWADRAAVGQAG